MRAADTASMMIAQAPSDGADGPAGATLAAALRDSGLLAECVTLAHHPANPRDLLDALVTVGRASLSAGRIFEGHVNAVKLLHLHGGPLDPVRDGQLHGIWGAEGQIPARIENGVLRGRKLFCSGADVLDRVIVTVRDGVQPQLLLFDRAQLLGRLYPDEWQVSGMRATASGRCDLDGLAVADAVPLGQPGDYMTEPHFHGGVWRYAAVQLGAMRALTAITADQLAARNQSAAPLQAMRLHRMVSACETARLWLDQAAHAIERPGATPADAETAILARLTVAEEAAALLALADQALGAASFATRHPADRIRRDLNFYLRQADPDGLAMGSLARILADPLLRNRWIG